MNQENKPKTTIPVNGCLYIIILTAIAIMAVRGCQTVNMKYKEQKAKHEMYMDSINKVNIIKNDTIQYRGK